MCKIFAVMIPNLFDFDINIFHIVFVLKLQFYFCYYNFILVNYTMILGTPIVYITTYQLSIDKTYNS